MVGIIYKYTNTINGKSYIGQTVNPIQRHNSHLSEAKTPKTLFHKALKKYGIESFTYEIICSVESNNKKELKEKLNECELKYIELYDTYRNGYNSTKGGDGVLIDGSNWKFINNDKINIVHSNGKHPNSHMRDGKKEKEKMAYDKIKNKVLCIETNELFESTRDVERKKGYKHQNIDSSCRKGCKCHGYHWRFIPVVKKNPLEYIDINKTLKENMELLFNNGIKIGRTKVATILSDKRKKERELLKKE